MPVVQRPAAAPRGVHRRPAATSELPQGVAAASSPAAQPPGRDAAESAIADEAWSELTALGDDARRKHVHWVHVRTHNPTHRQPESMTRREFWDHLQYVYEKVYPEAANETKSILLFGLVAKEWHAESSKEELRSEHHHAACYTAKQHYWKPVAAYSVRHCHIAMHAACHDGYSSMYEYLRKPSAKKPMSELDAEPFLSDRHPRGNQLRRLLELGARGLQAREGRRRLSPSAGAEDPEPKRVRAGDIFHIVKEHGFRSALALQAHAEAVAGRGDLTLATFCTTMGTLRLQEHLNAAWAVVDAPQKIAAPATRIDKLKACARDVPCTCGGVWKPGAARVLNNNAENIPRFGRDVCRALALGARRGVNMAVVGEPGSGKSMIFKPLDDIYKTMAPPESGSSFPLSALLDAEVLLWQDFEFEASTIQFSDLLRLLVGEKIGIRLPGSQNVPFKNSSPLFYTSNQKIATFRMPAANAMKKNQAMDERFAVRVWSRSLPLAERQADFPTCAPCFANFMLDSDAAFHAAGAE